MKSIRKKGAISLSIKIERIGTFKESASDKKHEGYCYQSNKKNNTT